MPIALNDNVRVNSQKPIDDRSGVFSIGSWRPYTSTTEANTLVPTIRRAPGVPVYIGSSIATMKTYYWTDLNAGTLVEQTVNTDNLVSFVAPSNANVPDTPLMFADNNANTIDFTSTLGDSEIEVSVNNGAFVPMSNVAGWNSSSNKIDVGDVQRPYAYYRARVRAASGRSASDIISSPRFKSLAELQGTLMYEDPFDGDLDTDILGRYPTSSQTDGNYWTKISGSGTLGVVNGTLTAFPTGTGGACRYTILHPQRNVDLRYTIGSIGNPSTGDGFGFWAIYGYSDPNNYFQTYLITGQTMKISGGASLQIGEGSGISAPGDEIRCYLNGTSLKIYRNSTQLLDIAISASEISGKNHGILCDGVESNLNTLTGFKSLYVGSENNTTPVAPTVSFSDGYLDFTHALGDSQIVVSLLDGPYLQLTSLKGWNAIVGKIFVGDLHRDAGFWKAKVKSATGRNESASVSSPLILSSAEISGSFIYEDTFSGADDVDINNRVPSTANVPAPQNWVKAAGQGIMSVINKELVGSPAGFSAASKSKYYLNHTLRNVDIRYILGGIAKVNSVNDYGIWAIFAYVNESYYFQSYLRTGETAKVVNGQVTKLYNGSGASVSGDVMRYVLNGTSLKIYRNTDLLTELGVSATEVYGTAHGVLCDGVELGNSLRRFSTFYINSPNNTTPAAPAMAVNDSANTIDFTSDLGDSEIVVSVNNSSTYVPLTSVSGWDAGTGKINYGDIHRDAGYYKAKIKYADGRNESAVVSTPILFTNSELSGTLIYEDTFNASNTLSIIGRTPTTVNPNLNGTWSKVEGLGNLQIVSNAVTSYPIENSPNSKSKHVLEHFSRNVDLRYTIAGITNPSTGSGFGMWAIYAYTDANNYMQTYLYSGETAKVVNGVGYPVYAGSGTSAAGDVMRIALNNTSLKIYRNNTLLTDSTISATENSGTKHGILCDSTTSTADSIDKFTSLYI